MHGAPSPSSRLVCHIDHTTSPCRLCPTSLYCATLLPCYTSLLLASRPDSTVLLSVLLTIVSRYHSSTTLSDTGSGSISASPISSASSSLAYSSFTPTAAVYSNQIPQISVANNFQAAPFAYPYNNPMSSIRRNSSIADASSSTMLPPNNPVSPSLGSAARDNYTTSTPGLLRHSHTLSPRLSDVSRYSSLPDTPRSVLSTAMSLPASSAYGSTGALGYTTSAQIPDSPPFNPQETFVEITCEGNPVQPNIEAKIEKGFFWSSDRVWTCYRRNYFAVTVSYTLSPWIPNGRLYITRSGKGPEQVQSMAVSLAAAVDNSNGKSVELIQHTPKRDRGPQLAIKKELLLPTPPGKTHETGSYSLTNFHQNTSVPGPQLPLQNEPEPSHSYSQAGHSSSTNYQHAFERIQFKCATANNGKRRAQQQYYHLIVELWANVQNPRDSQPEWVKVATKSSSHVVVRGRSPSHYQNEGPHNSHGSRGGAAGMGGSGHQGLGSNGGPTYGGSYGRLGLNGPSTMSGSTYRGTAYSLDPSPVGSHSVSSASSLSGGPVEGLVDQHMVDEEENKPLHAPEGYQYYPHTIYESLPAKLEGTGLPHPDRRVKDEYAGATAVPSGWSGGGCGRFQGMESSRGFYPDVHAHLGY
ncbi:p53-like transcription factor [Westerdykella ornata]|uniref:p53-like transcription factor n=1 Tax=Westerdykella ornata TaxID=318751 RepID=A0A6A6JQR4_WESOR|nr:p53-like transcription factor [Westerdykella ornata]KAF2278605.1 p53-like transcription factor [Westerdykella ornata]